MKQGIAEFSIGDQHDATGLDTCGEAKASRKAVPVVAQIETMEGLLRAKAARQKWLNSRSLRPGGPAEGLE